MLLCNIGVVKAM